MSGWAGRWHHRDRTIADGRPGSKANAPLARAARQVAQVIAGGAGQVAVRAHGVGRQVEQGRLCEEVVRQVRGRWAGREGGRRSTVEQVAWVG